MILIMFNDIIERFHLVARSSLNLLFFYLHTRMYVDVWVCTYHGECVEVRRRVVCSGDPARLVGLGSKCLYSLGLLAGLASFTLSWKALINKDNDIALNQHRHRHDKDIN